MAENLMICGGVAGFSVLLYEENRVKRVLRKGLELEEAVDLILKESRTKGIKNSLCLKTIADARDRVQREIIKAARASLERIASHKCLFTPLKGKKFCGISHCCPCIARKTLGEFNG